MTKDKAFSWRQQSNGYKVFDARKTGDERGIAIFQDSTEATNWCMAMELCEKLMDMTKWNQGYMRVLGVDRFIDDELSSTMFFWDKGGINLKYLKKQVKGIEDETRRGIDHVVECNKKIIEYLQSQEYDDFKNLKEVIEAMENE